MCNVYITIILIIGLTKELRKDEYYVEGESLSVDMDYSYGEFKLNSMVGPTFQHFNLIMDLESPYSFQGYLLPKERQNFSLIKENISFDIHKSKKGRGNEYRSLLYLYTNQLLKIDNFSFYIINDYEDKSRKDEKRFAFSHCISNTHHSITHLLKRQGNIKKAKFSFLINEGTEGKIIFGNTPKVITNKFIYNLTIQLSSISSKNWEFNLCYFAIGNISNINTIKYIKNDKIARFSTNAFLNNMNLQFDSLGKFNTRAPLSVINLIKIEIFKELIESKICKFFSGIYLIQCLCDKIPKNLPQIHFIFNSNVASLNASDFFFYSKGMCNFGITRNPENPDSWVLGTNFLSKFYSVFDYENHQVTLMSQSENFDLIDSSYLNSGINFLIIGIIALVIVIITYIITAGIDFLNDRNIVKRSDYVEKEFMKF